MLLLISVDAASLEEGMHHDAIGIPHYSRETDTVAVSFKCAVYLQKLAAEENDSSTTIQNEML
jgi:hypothetical protein